MKKASTYARARVTIDVPMSPYGPEWTLQAIHEQVEREAVAKVERLVRQEGCKIVGEVFVSTIMTQQEPG